MIVENPKNPNKMRKFGAMMRCSKCKVMRHNKRAYPLNRDGTTQVSQSATQVELLPNLQQV
jgi:hypothetical protein